MGLCFSTQKQYKSFFINSPEAFVIVSSNGYFLKVNNSFSKLLNYTVEELKGKSIFDVMVPEDHEPTRGVMKLLDNKKPLYNFTNRYLKKNSSKFVIFHWTAHNIDGDYYACAKPVRIIETTIPVADGYTFNTIDHIIERRLVVGEPNDVNIRDSF